MRIFNQSAILMMCLNIVVFSGGVSAQNNTNYTLSAAVKGNIKGLKEGTKIHLVPNFSTGQRDSSVVKNGRFSLNIKLEEGNSYSLRMTPLFEPGKWIDLYLDEGIMHITSKSADVGDFRFTGSTFAKDLDSYYTWLRKNNHFKKEETVAIKSALAEKNNDIELGTVAYKEYLANDSVKSVLSKKWIVNNLNSPISAFAIHANVRRFISLEELDEILVSLSPLAKNNALAKIMENKVQASKTVLVGNIAPDFTQPDTLNRNVSLSDFRGKYVFVDFWASWCVPCRKEHPDLIRAFDRFSEKGFTILSVSLDEKKDKWIEAIYKDKLKWTQVSDLRAWDNRASRKYGVSSVPYNLLIDPEGKVVATEISGEELNQKLEEIFSK